MAVDPEVLPNLPHGEDDFFVIEEEQDTGEMFDHEKQYSVDEFLRILRLIFQRYIDDPGSADVVNVLEHWERRVTDHITAHPEDRESTFIGFVFGEDRIMRIELILSYKDVLR